MERGPLHSIMFNLIKGEDSESPNWSKKFITDRYDIQMIHDPGVSELTKYEIGLLNEISRQFQDDDEWAVGNYTHGFQEFVPHKPDGETKRSRRHPFRGYHQGSAARRHRVR